MKREYLDSIIFQLSLNKKPYEMFLELLMEYFFNSNFTGDELNNLKNNNIDTIIKDIENRYGIILQDYSLKIWLDREFTLKENKLILNKYKDLSIECIEENINKKNHDEKEFLNRVSNVIDKFINYAKSNDFTINKEDAKDIFFKYNYIPYDDIDENDKVESYQNKVNFLFYSFVKEIIDNNTEEDLKVIEDCGIANQFSNMIFSKDSFNKEIFNKTTLYLDTPIILKYLGYAGIKIRDSYKSLLYSIKKEYNCNFAIFNHIIEEMQTIIYTLQLRVIQGFLNAPNVNEFLNARKENDKLPLENDGINDAIKKEGIFIDNNTYIDSNMSDEENMRDILIDENNLKEYMLSEYKIDKKNNKYLLETRINADIKSTSLISINRNRYKKTCFLLTQNIAFKKSVKKYHDKNKEYFDDYYPNEILTENDIIFNLWQNTGDNFNNSFREFFRLKCFSYLKIDNKFKDEFYIKSKRLYEQANQNKKDKLKGLDGILINNPQYLLEAYRKRIKFNTDTYKIFKELADSGIDEIKKETLNEVKRQTEEALNKVKKQYEEKTDKALNDVKMQYVKQANKDIENNSMKLIEIAVSEQLYSMVSVKFINILIMVFPFFKNKLNNFIKNKENEIRDKLIDKMKSDNLVIKK